MSFCFLYSLFRYTHDVKQILKSNKSKHQYFISVSCQHKMTVQWVELQRIRSSALLGKLCFCSKICTTKRLLTLDGEPSVIFTSCQRME